MAEGKEVVGGAVKGKAQVQSPETQDATDEDMEATTTAPGVLSSLGIIPEGTKIKLHPSKFSENWMMPASNKDAKKFADWRRAQQAYEDD